MPMPAGVVLSVAVSVALAASPPALPRLILSLQKGAPGKLTVRVENVGNQPLVLAGRTYLALSSERSDGAQVPVYWGEVTALGSAHDVETHAPGGQAETGCPVGPPVGTVVARSFGLGRRAHSGSGRPPWGL